MPVNVGSVLTVNYATWVDQYPIELTGTVGVGDNPADYQLYLGASASSTPNIYADGYWYLTYNTMSSSPANSLITAYNSTTKIATVAWASADKNPSVGSTWKLFNRIPVQRQFRWYRDGVLIPNVYADVYTVQNADAGKTITVQEIAGFVPPSTTAALIPTVTSSSTSAGMAVNSGSTGSGLVGADDFVYVGSFRIPSTYQNSTGYYCESSVKGISVIPPAYSYNGQRVLLMTGLTNGTFAQLQIPADGSLGNPTTYPNWQNLPYATMIFPAQGSTNPGMSNVAVGRGISDGLDPANGTFTSRAQHISGTTKFLFTIYNPYSYQGTAYTYRADLNFNPATVEGPVITVQPSKVNNARAYAGGACKIPSALQASLGGDLIVSNPQSSIVSANSDGPALFTFSSAGFDAAYANTETGVARAGSSTTIQLAATATGTTSSYYDGFWVKTADNVESLAVSSYNPTTKTITINSNIHGFIPAPANGTSYTLIPPLIGSALAFYTVDQFQPTIAGVSNPIYTNANAIVHAVLPSGTTSVLCFGSGPQGVFLYGVNNKPDNSQLMRIYDPNNPSGTGQHQSCSAEDAGFKAWAYDTNTLLQVKAGTITVGAVQPYGIFKVFNPYGNLGLPTGSSVQSFAYDQETRRLYIVQTFQGGSAPAVCHVYTITSATSENI
jgi:hypothetical protein